MGDVLRATGLRKSYRGVDAVDDVDLHVGAQERVALLGPNGAGKTTTLLMLLGAITPDAGQVSVLGQPMPRHRSRAMRGVGFVAGYLPLPDRLRVREALRLFAQLYGLRPDESEVAITDALERFHIPHLGDRMCLELSSGQRTLVGICKAILHEPRLLVLDEPTASLDPDVAYRVRHGIEALSEEQGTALLVTSHNMVEVERLCERVVFLSAGHVVANGSPAEVAGSFGHGSLEGVFLELAGTIHSEHELVDEGVAGADMLPDRVVIEASAVEPAAVRVRAVDRRSPAPNDHDAPAPPPDRGSSWLRIRSIAQRHAFVLRRSPHRWFDIVIWPMVDAVLFGSLGVYVARQSGSSSASPAGAAYLLTGILLFHVIYQVQIALSTGFLEETWSRNILNLMTTPLRELEYVLGVALFGFAKLVVGLTVVGAAAVAFFAFNILSVGWGLFPIAILLIFSGFAISFFVIGLVLRFGQSAEVLAWGILFVVMPLSGVFYPVDALPAVMQPIAYALPTTHAFVAARDLLAGQPMPWDQLAVAVIGVIAALALGIAFLYRMLGTFRRRGFITRFS
ncbi:MAG: ABC transporter ATP-binding protein/permease [Actinobacteria bacterium]|nr:ABC transporter ATP-binding protein/permease [Actinomycetota bacterium]